jgi:hypothetical protein
VSLGSEDFLDSPSLDFSFSNFLISSFNSLIFLGLIESSSNSFRVVKAFNFFLRFAISLSINLDLALSAATLPVSSIDLISIASFRLPYPDDLYLPLASFGLLWPGNSSLYHKPSIPN